MFEGIMIVWFLLTGLSLVFAIYDLASNTPVSWVQKLAWILVIAYTGPYRTVRVSFGLQKSGARSA